VPSLPLTRLHPPAPASTRDLLWNVSFLTILFFSPAVNATCDAAAAMTDLIDLAVNVTDTFYGYDGKTCLDGEGQGGSPGGGPGPASWGPWGYQSCTETLHQFSSSSSTGHGFRDFTFSLNASAQQCEALYKARPRPHCAQDTIGERGMAKGAAYFEISVCEAMLL
jgi:hypothetical protein